MKNLPFIFILLLLLEGFPFRACFQIRNARIRDYFRAG